MTITGERATHIYRTADGGNDRARLLLGRAPPLQMPVLRPWRAMERHQLSALRQRYEASPSCRPGSTPPRGRRPATQAPPARVVLLSDSLGFLDAWWPIWIVPDSVREVS